MKFETKFALGEKVISKIDGGFCGAVVVAVVIRSTTDGEHINYELVCSVPLPPEVTKSPAASLKSALPLRPKPS